MDRRGDSTEFAMRRPTMREIADEVGVNKSTVSRVLNDHDSSASAATANAIRQAARDLGYRIDPWAASLRTRRTLTIGVLLARLSDVVLARVFEAIEAEAARLGYQVLVASTGDDPVEQRRRIQLLQGRRVDGFILTSVHLGEEAYLDDLERQGIPFVLAYRSVGHHTVIRGDDYDGGCQATRHLLATGHRRIGVIAGPEYAPGATARVRGYRDALAEVGIIPDTALIKPSERDVGGGERVARQLLALRSPPTAVFAVNDFVAMGAMSAIHEAGLRVGTDVAVVGYNDIPLSARLPVPLSSVHHPLQDIGQLAVHRLLELLDGTSPESTTLPVQLRVRASSRP